jgi:hypothetical protein
MPEEGLEPQTRIMIPDGFGLTIGCFVSVGHAVGHNCTLGLTPFRVSAADGARPRHEPNSPVDDRGTSVVAAKEKTGLFYPSPGYPIQADGTKTRGQETSAPGSLPRCMELDTDGAATALTQTE